jgi:hypothetical protein
MSHRSLERSRARLTHPTREPNRSQNGRREPERVLKAPHLATKFEPTDEFRRGKFSFFAEPFSAVIRPRASQDFKIPALMIVGAIHTKRSLVLFVILHTIFANR